MGWQQGIALVIGGLFVLLILRSMLRQWRQGDSKVPLRGRLHAAREWMQENGYHVVRVRQRSEWVGYYDSREFRKQYIADFIARKGAKYYAVKVLSSREKGLNGLKMRDQWFPLYMGFRVDGILHLDVDNERVHEVDFELKSPAFVIWRKIINRSLWFLAGMIVALAWFHGG